MLQNDSILILGILLGVLYSLIFNYAYSTISGIVARRKQKRLDKEEQEEEEKGTSELQFIVDGDYYQNRISKDVVMLFEWEVVFKDELEGYVLKDKQSKYTYVYDKIIFEGEVDDTD